jgi:hypothetical protein
MNYEIWTVKANGGKNLSSSTGDYDEAIRRAKNHSVRAVVYGANRITPIWSDSSDSRPFDR